MITMIVILGLCEVYDHFVPEEVPHVGNLGHASSLRLTAELCMDSHLGVPPDDEKCWEGLSHSLSILKKVCAPAELWVRDRHKQGKLSFTRTPDGTYARYVFHSQELIISPEFWNRKEGYKAVTLAHEFRHSRQNFTQRVRAGFSALVFGDPREGILEDDAYAFENKVYLAIYD
jgi:hypothetical protein